MTIVPLFRFDAQHTQAQACAACSVRGRSLFGALDDAGLNRIHAHIANVELQPGKTLFEAGARGRAVHGSFGHRALRARHRTR